MTRLDILDAAYEVIGNNQSKFDTCADRDSLLAGLAFNNGVMTLADYLLQFADPAKEQNNE